MLHFSNGFSKVFFFISKFHQKQQLKFHHFPLFLKLLQQDLDSTFVVVIYSTSIDSSNLLFCEKFDGFVCTICWLFIYFKLDNFTERITKTANYGYWKCPTATPLSRFQYCKFGLGIIFKGEIRLKFFFFTYFLE